MDYKEILFLLWLFLLLVVVLFYKKKEKSLLSIEKKLFFEHQFKIISWKTSPKEKIIDTDKLFHKLLLEIWYSWNFWDILKSKPKEIKNLDKVWEFHKLRNKLVHDFDLVSNNILLKKSRLFLAEFNILLRFL